MRIVVKLGTSTLTHATGKLNIRRVELLCKVMSDLKNAGHELVLVSSGAIAMGVGKLNLAKKPSDIPTKQALAAVGQCELMYIYDKLFSDYHHTVAQILLTGSDVEDPQRRENFHNTMSRLLELGALPVINENDTVATGGRRGGERPGGPAGAHERHRGALHRRPPEGPRRAAHQRGPGADAGDPGFGGGRGQRPGHRRHGDQAPGRGHVHGGGVRYDHHQRPEARGPVPHRGRRTGGH